MSMLVASDDLLSEQSYLVARGVRPIALAGHMHVAADDLLRLATRVERAASEGCLPFVIDHSDGTASYGYAAERWALDLYEWAVRDPHVPEEQRDRIVGLLLGYSGPSVARYEDEGSGRRFTISASAG
jgi:hypothetical protein